MVKEFFLSSFNLIDQLDKPFCQFLKDSKKCNVIYRSESTVNQVTGTLRLSSDVPNRFSKIIIKTDEGDLQLSIDDIVRIDSCEKP